MRVEYFFCTVVFVACSSMGYPIPSHDSENPDSPFKRKHFSMAVNLLFFGYAQHLQALKTEKDFEVLVLFRSFSVC